MTPRLVILCVDDEEIILNSLQEELGVSFAEDYDLEFAINAADALELIEELEEDEEVELAVVLSDYIMPEMTGDNFLIKVHEDYPRVKKIMLTGQSRIDGVSRAVNQADLYRYLEKPWDSQDMQLTIEKALQSYEDGQQLLQQNQQLKEINSSLEEKVTNRTAELSQTLERLKKSEVQLVQAEQMNTLGIMTNHIAQQLEMPLNLIDNGVGVMQQFGRDISELWTAFSALKSATTPELKTQAVEKLTAIEAELNPEEIQEDFVGVLQDMGKGAKQATEIITSLLNFTRMNQGEFHYVDIHEGLDSVLTLLRNDTRHRIEVVKKYDEHVSEICCIFGQLNQVFLHLLENAIAAIEGEGKITISTQKVNDEVVIKITDSGKGMNQETVDNIFEPFFTTNEENGTGLGLSISKSIIEKHQGKISVESTKGEGTCFTILLPKEQQT